MNHTKLSVSTHTIFRNQKFGLVHSPLLFYSNLIKFLSNSSRVLRPQLKRAVNTLLQILFHAGEGKLLFGNSVGVVTFSKLTRSSIALKLRHCQLHYAIKNGVKMHS